MKNTRTDQVIDANLSVGDRIAGLYRGVPYSGTIQKFDSNIKTLVVSAYVILDNAICGQNIMPRTAGEILKVNEPAVKIA